MNGQQAYSLLHRHLAVLVRFYLESPRPRLFVHEYKLLGTHRVPPDQRVLSSDLFYAVHGTPPCISHFSSPTQSKGSCPLKQFREHAALVREPFSSLHPFREHV